MVHKANIKRNSYDILSAMDVGRKRTLLIAACIIAARRLADWDGGAASPKHVAAISDSIRIAEKILAEIDRHWPEQSKNNWRDSLREKDQRH